MIGQVKFYNPKKNSGFIVVKTPEGLKDYFYHRSQIVITCDETRIGKKYLETGDWVEFEIGTAPNGRTAAINVRPINETEFKARGEFPTPDI